MLKIFSFIIAMNVMAGDHDPYEILEGVKNRYFEISDFYAKATIVVDVDFVNMPDKEIEVFYKFPSRVKIRTEGFALIPKKGMNFSIYELFKYEYSAIYIQEIEEKGQIIDEIKFIPMDKKSDLAIATLWIDHENQRINRIEGIPKKGGNFTMDLDYASTEDILPQKTQISFDVQQMKIPFRFFGNIKVDKDKLEETGEGKVIITYRDYRINQGLKDDMFFEGDSVKK